MQSFAYICMLNTYFLHMLYIYMHCMFRAFCIFCASNIQICYVEVNVMAYFVHILCIYLHIFCIFSAYCMHIYAYRMHILCIYMHNLCIYFSYSLCWSLCNGIFYAFFMHISLIISVYLQRMLCIFYAYYIHILCI